MNKFQKLLKKKHKSKIVCLTAYSKNISNILDNHCDIVLVGDSLGSVLYNFKSTKSVSLDMMIEHSKSVQKGIKKSILVVDMPHNTYRSNKEALKNAKKIISKTKCDAVKLEGGNKTINIVKYLRKNKIQVMGHLGVLPQSQKGKFSYKGKKINERNKIFKDAKLLESAGVFSLVLECVESSLAKKITSTLEVPTIGIGSSINCDGQVLVTDDLLGLNPMNVRFIKRYANIRKVINKAVFDYSKDVRKKRFPKKQHSYLLI